MKLSFGNMTLEVNIFHVEKLPWDEDECYQTYIINMLIQKEVHLYDHYISSEYLLLNHNSESLFFYFLYFSFLNSLLGVLYPQVSFILYSFISYFIFVIVKTLLYLGCGWRCFKHNFYAHFQYILFWLHYLI